MEPYITFSFEEGDKSPLILFTQTVEGDGHYNFELSAWYQKGCGCYLEIRSVPTSEEQFVYCPFSALSELRKRMVKILAEHDGSQQIGEMPTIPVWTTRGFSNSKFFLHLFFSL
jgi:hypothetical protein